MLLLFSVFFFISVIIFFILTCSILMVCISLFMLLSLFWNSHWVPPFFSVVHWAFFFNFNFVLLFNYSCVPFLPFPPPTPAEPTSLPHLHPTPWFCPCVLYSSSCNPFSSLSPPHSPLPIVRLFLTSKSLGIFCLLFSSIYYVPVKGEIIWYLSLTTWLISLSIMLSSSIHAVTKGISSSFSLLCRIPLCKYTIVFGSTRLLMGTSVASSTWLL